MGRKPNRPQNSGFQPLPFKQQISNEVLCRKQIYKSDRKIKHSFSKLSYLESLLLFLSLGTVPEVTI